MPFARSAGLGPAAATFAITVGAFGNAGGRILSGWLSDMMGRLTTLRVMVLASAVAMPALFIWRQEVLLFPTSLVAVVYWCYGTQLSVFASATADLYGTRNLGLNYGVLYRVGRRGSRARMIAARVYDASGGYGYAFYAASVLAVVAFVALTIARSAAAVPAARAAYVR